MAKSKTIFDEIDQDAEARLPRPRRTLPPGELCPTRRW